MVADHTLSDKIETYYDAVVLPGGPQGSVNLAASAEVLRFVAAHDEAGKIIAPICSAAARVLGGNLISGKGLGHAFDFALTLSARLLGDDAPVRDHAEHIYYPW